MQRINIYPMFHMGGNLALLLDRLNTKTDYTFSELARDSSAVIANLAEWAVDVLLSAPHSKKTAAAVGEALLSWTGDEWLKDHGSEVVSQDTKGRLMFGIEHFRGLLFEELGYLDLFSITEKRLYNMKGLIFNAEKVLPETVINEISLECKQEVQEAGRALAFDLPTACGFHAFRALEMIVLMYFPVLGLDLPKEQIRSLGNYIKLLKGEQLDGQKVEPDKVVDPKITTMLEQLKKFYRNPLIHPELTLEEEEAQSLFTLISDAISQMVKDIIKRRPTAANESEKEIKS